MRILQVACLAAVLWIPGVRVGGATLPAQVEGHHSGLAARVVDASGTARDVRLDGVGCTETMCSRVFLMSTSGRIWLDSIASIFASSTDSTADSALFVMKDGTKRRTALTPDFRVLYVTDGHGRGGKINLTAIRSIEF